ncbi:solute carrier organic anion transporter family member 74D-like [Planococcus citri]|uniref:solute carrier organic anion transporter family member 74D-like n=1 Tax=Planococcus citri TaxID=170843 RepID=UPI0031F7514C
MKDKYELENPPVEDEGLQMGKFEMKREAIPEKTNDEATNKVGLTPESETRCGFGCFYPKWLQILASKKTFVVVYAFAGMQQFIIGSYFIGTLSTIEKNYNMSSRMSGIITGIWDLGSLVTNIVITYIAAKGHRTRWVAAGMFLAGISCFMKILPYLVFGPGQNVKMYTKEYKDIFSENMLNNLTQIDKMSTNVNCGADNSMVDIFAFCIFFVSSIVLGMGTAVYWTCGAAYLDDNARKNIVPVLLAVVQSIRLFGPTIGFLISSYALKIYIEPNLTPTINNEDPRWVGAWWIGWYPIGVLCWVSAALLVMFPRTLPRAALRRQTDPQEPENLSWNDFKVSLTRIMKNKVVVLNSFSSVCFAMGLMAYWTFMPKYMESQFRLSASKSNFLTGTVGILSNALGIMTAGLVISKLKPSPRFLAGWNVFVEFLDCIGHASYSWLSCPEQPFHGHWNDDHHTWNLTESCNVKYQCGNDIQYAPVCDMSRGIAYYSSCHAGCQKSSRINDTLMYHNCSCVPDFGSVTDGICPIDCSKNILIFVIILGTLSFTSATGRSANTLIQFRCVDDKDKSLSIGVTEGLLSLLAYMPAPIFFGIIMDWACTVWGDNCGSRGNCWIYDSGRLQMFNFTAASFLLLGVILDSFVWYHVKGLRIYDEDFEKANDIQDKPKLVSKNNNIKNEVELPLISSPNNAENK